jgi:endoglucanase
MSTRPAAGIRVLKPVRSITRMACAVVACSLALAGCAVDEPVVPVKPGSQIAAEPRVSGNRLIDARTGDAWIPRGVNYPSFGYACAQGWGTSLDSAVGAAGVATARAIAAWEANVVRLPLNQDCWNGAAGIKPEYGGAAYQAAVQAFVEQLNAAGLVVILDLHSRLTGPQQSGQRAMPDTESLTFFTSLSAAYADNPSIMFDAFNEPYSAWDHDGNQVLDLTWGCWCDGGCRAPVEGDDQSFSGATYATVGMTDVVAAIRSAGAGQPILVSGLDYANDLSEWLHNRPEDDQLVASIHSYSTQRCAAPACWDTEIVPITEQVPVVFGEFGGNPGDGDSNAAYMERLMDWADEVGVGYLGWAWWVLEPGDTDSDAYGLLADDDGTPRAPAGTTLKAHLADVG